MNAHTQDHDLNLFGNAISYLVDASEISFNIDLSNQGSLSQGVVGFGHIGTLDELASLMNFKGWRTKKGRLINGTLLKKMKSRLIKKYGHDEFFARLDDYVDWSRISSRVQH